MPVQHVARAGNVYVGRGSVLHIESAGGPKQSPQRGILMKFFVQNRLVPVTTKQLYKLVSDYESREIKLGVTIGILVMKACHFSCSTTGFPRRY